MAVEFPTIAVHTDEQTLTLDSENRVTVKISNAENNGLYIGEDNKLHLKRGNTSDEDSNVNTPGNAIAGSVGKGISKIKCANFVTRLVERPNDVASPILVDAIVNGILNS